MAVLDYAGYSALATKTYTASGGSFKGTATTMQFSEVIEFGAETIGVGFKTIACTYKVKDSAMVGYLYVPETLETYFVFGNARKVNGDFDITGGVLTIFHPTDATIWIEYV